MNKVIRFLLVLVLLAPHFFVSAQEAANNPTTATAISSNKGLEIISVQPAGPRVIDLTFSENVDINSIRVTVENQTSKQLMRVRTYEHSEYGNTVVRVILETDLAPASTYTLIVNSVISEKNNTIKDGIDAIRDFITPAKFSEETMNFNAPSNNAAVIIAPTETATGNIVDNINLDEVLPNQISKPSELKAEVVNDAEELPNTGVQTTLLIVLFVLVSLVVLGTARRKSI